MQRIILPCYAQFSGESTNRPVKMPMFFDTDLYNRLITSGEGTYTLQSWRDIIDMNPALRVNNWLNSEFVSKSIPQYVTTTPLNRG